MRASLVSRISFSIVLLTLLPAFAAAQTGLGVFKATLTGAQEVPPTGSAAIGYARVQLNGTGTNVFVSLTFSGLGSNQTAAHIHGPAVPGATGPIIFDIGSTGATSGTFTGLIFAVTEQQALDLFNGLWYFNVHSADFPDGEIRGQIVPDSAFIATLSGAQEVPSNGSSATGIANVQLNSAETQIFVSVSFGNLGTTQTGAHVHGPAVPGVNGGVLFDIGSLGTATGAFRGVLFSITPTQVAQLKAGLFYVNVHSVNFPNGEIRGQLRPYNKPVDFDGDSRAEVGVYREGASSIWYTLNHVTNAFNAVQFGTTGDVLVPTDLDKDTKTDTLVWRPGNGFFYVLFSTDGSFDAVQFGTAGDDPRVSGDYGGDGWADLVAWRQGAPGTPAIFHLLDVPREVYRAVPFGVSGSDVTVSGDYDGDRASDFAVYRTGPGIYYILRSTLGFFGQQFGVSATDTLVPGDYDGDGKTDLAVFRFGGATPGTWYIWQSSTGTLRSEAFGLGTDSPVPADYDGDGKTDLAVTRTSGGAYTWFILQSSTGTLKGVGFGASGDVRLTNYLVR
jgi:hypothetical protein